MSFKSDKQRRGFYGSRGRLNRGSGEGRVMNKGLQVYNIKRELQIEGIDPDKVDVESEVDMTLRFSENRDNVLQKIERDPERFYGKRLDDDALSFEKDHALDFHEQRSEASQRMDESRTATTIISDKQIIINPNVTDKWYDHPNQSDIQGVDDR